jgi:hypothetical protein
VKSEMRKNSNNFQTWSAYLLDDNLSTDSERHISDKLYRERKKKKIEKGVGGINRIDKLQS